MHFQQPNFLWGLLLLLLPLIIHLFQFRRFQTLNFPGVHRLREQLSASKKTQTIKHWYLLASRLLAFFFLILAFSMPTCNQTSSTQSNNRKVILVIDCSPSMGLTSDGQSLIEQARNAARKIISQANANTEFAVVANHLQSKQQWIDARKALNLISDIQVSEFPENFGRWNEDLESLLSSQEKGNSSVYIITDNQEDIYNGYRTIDYKKASFSIIQLQTPEVVNLSVDTAYFLNPIMSQNVNRKLVVHVHASNQQYDGKCLVQLLNGEKIIGSQEVVFSAETNKIIQFQVPESIKGSLKLQLEDQAIMSDNVLYLHEISQDACNIEVFGQTNPYFQKLIKTQPIFVPSTGSNIEITKAKTLLFSNIDNINLATLKLIDQKASDGKNVVFIPNEQSKSFFASWGINGTWKTEKLSLAPNGFLNDVFKGIFTNEIDQKTQFPFIESYFKIEKISNNQDWQTILSLENGDPILIQKDYGQGSIWLWLSEFKQGSLSFAKSSWFLPVFTQILLGKSIDSKPLLGYVHSKIPMALGSDLSFSIEKGGILKNNAGEWVVTLEVLDQNIALNTNVPLKKSGYYKLYPSAQSKDFIEVALNSLRSEKDLKLVSTDIKNEIQNLGVKFVQNSSLQSKLMMVQSDQGLWKLFLWVSLLFFALEYVLLYYKNKTKNIELK